MDPDPIVHVLMEEVNTKDQRTRNIVCATTVYVALQ